MFLQIFSIISISFEFPFLNVSYLFNSFFLSSVIFNYSILILSNLLALFKFFCFTELNLLTIDSEVNSFVFKLIMLSIKFLLNKPHIDFLVTLILSILDLLSIFWLVLQLSILRYSLRFTFDFLGRNKLILLIFLDNYLLEFLFLSLHL